MITKNEFSGLLDIDTPIFTSEGVRELYEKKRDELKLSDRQIQKMLGIDGNTLKPILDGDAKQINFINIIKLSHFLSIHINNLAEIYLPNLSTEQIGEIQKAKETSYIIENLEVSALQNIKFFNKKMTTKEMVERVKKFFGLNSLYEYTRNELYSVFSRTKRDSNLLMRNFWVQSAMVQFRYINNPNFYDRQALVELIPKIRPYTRDVKNGLIKVLKALYNVGVTVIYQPSLEKVQVRGATISVNRKPCIVLSNLQQNYPTLWFVLLHELHHVLYDFEEIEKRTYHISSNEGDLFLMDEEKADNFATDYLLNESRLKYASNFIESHTMIEKLASQWGVHSSIIYAIYCYQTKQWSLYNKYIPKMNEALELLNTHPFEKETLMEAVQELKTTIYI